jgi:hypothetical protein
VDDRD